MSKTRIAGNISEENYSIITVDEHNIDEFGIFCVKNKKHPGYQAKRSWLEERFAEGLKLKMLITSDQRQAGFIEYVPGEYTWRVIHAPEHLVIQCIWVDANKFPFKGMASDLIRSVIDEAQAAGKAGVAVVTSDGTWMANSSIYIKNGFIQIDEADPHFQLLVKQLRGEPMPSFPGNWHDRHQQYSGLQLIYTDQCPFIAKAVQELPPVAVKHGINLKLVELKTSAEAREKMLSPYGTINLIYEGRLLADHAISATRFKNILQKDLQLKPKQ